MGKRIVLRQGHPDTAPGRLCRALANADAQGATDAGHEVRRVDIATLDFPLLHSEREWERDAVPAVLQQSQRDIAWSEHIVLFFPLWLGDMPALLKGFLEQVARPGFAFTRDGANPFGKNGLKGRSGRPVVTMGMLALVYRLFYRAHSVRSLRRDVFGFVGIAPVGDIIEPVDINIGAVVRYTKTDFYMAECFDPASQGCAYSAGRRLKGVLGAATAACLQVLDGVTLADMLADNVENTAPADAVKLSPVHMHMHMHMHPRATHGQAPSPLAMSFGAAPVWIEAANLPRAKAGITCRDQSVHE